MFRYKNLSMIVATDKLGCIGKDNTLPWKDKQEMEVFKEYTTGDNVVLITTRKTLETIPNLEEFASKRKDILAITNNEALLDTSKGNIHYVGLTDVLSTMVLEHLENRDTRYIVIGGTGIYKYFNDIASEVVWSVGNFIVEEGDTYFTPNLTKGKIVETKELDNFTTYKIKFENRHKTNLVS